MKRLKSSTIKNKSLLFLALCIIFGFNATAQYKENTENTTPGHILERRCGRTV